MKVIVTREHIENGERYAPRSCPISIALADVFPTSQSRYWSVGPYSAAIVDYRGIRDDAYPLITLPDKVYRFICDYDSNRKVEPMEFEIDDPR